MSESKETTETFKNLVNNGLVTKTDLVKEGFHEAATEVMVGGSGGEGSVARRSSTKDDDNARRPLLANGAARAREEGGEEEAEKTTCYLESGVLAGGRPRSGSSASETVSHAAAAAAGGFAKLADELGKMIIADREAAQHPVDERPVDPSTGAPIDEESGSPTITENTILSGFCANLFGGGKGSAKEEGGDEGDECCHLEHREPPKGMM